MPTPLNQTDAIRNLQVYLRALSFFDPRISRVPTDGIYGNGTRRAVLEFQRSRGLRESGTVDLETWNAIYDEYLSLLRASERERSPSFFPTHSDRYVAKEGERSSFVAVIQLMLRELSSIFDTIPLLDIDGAYGENTKNAVLAFQEASLLEVTGEVDIETYNRLSNAFIASSLY